MIATNKLLKPVYAILWAVPGFSIRNGQVPRQGLDCYQDVAKNPSPTVYNIFP